MAFATTDHRQHATTRWYVRSDHHVDRRSNRIVWLHQPTTMTRHSAPIDRRFAHALDVVEIELGDQRKVIADFLGTPTQPTEVVPAGFHAFVTHIAQPAAEHGCPESIPHATFSRVSLMAWIR